MEKDFESFRLLMLNRIASIIPPWRDIESSDLGIVLVELLAYVADALSYYQDAVATEASLGPDGKKILKIPLPFLAIFSARFFELKFRQI